MNRRVATGLLITTLTGLAIFFLWPLGVILQSALVDAQGHLTSAFLREVFLHPLYREGLVNAALIAVATTIGCVLIAGPLSFCYARYRFPGRTMFHALVLSPLLLPPFVGVLGAQMILGRQGSLNALLLALGWEGDLPDWLGHGRMIGIILMNILHLYPILYTQLSDLLLEMDPALEEAAASLGAGPCRRLFRITLPLTRPGLFAGSSITFIWAFTELGVPLLFDFDRVTSVQIFNGIRDLEGNPYPYALVLVMLIVTAALFLLSRLFLIGGTALGGGRAVQSRVLVDPRKTRALLISGAFLGVSLVALGPHFGVLLLAFATDWYGSVLPETLTLRHFNAALGHDLTLSSLANSLRYASASTLIDLGLGTTVAFVLIRSKASGRALLDGLMMLPLAVPGIVLALGYLALAREGQPFHVLIVGGDPFWLLVIAYAVRRLPYVVRAMTAGLQQISVTYEEAALSLGAGPARVFGRVTLPLLVPALLTGGTLAFAFAMLDVSDSMILAQRTVHFPITKAIYSLAGTIGEGPALAAALGVWSMVFLTALLPGLSLVIGSGSRRGLSRG